MPKKKINIDWDKVKEEYRRGATIKDLSIRYNVKVNTVKGRRQREKWKRADNIISSNKKPIKISQYEEGYSPRDLKKFFSTTEKILDLIFVTSISQAHNLTQKKGFTRNMPYYNYVFTEFLDRLQNHYIDNLKNHYIIDLVLLDKISLAMGKKRRVVRKYNKSGELIETTVTTLQATEQERQDALLLLQQNAKYKAEHTL